MCQARHTAKSLFAKCFYFCRVFRGWHTAKKTFAVCPILCTRQTLAHTANYHFPVVRLTHSSLIESQSPSRIGALWIVIVIWSSPSHPPLLAASCAHRLPARLGLASHTYPPRWHAVRHGFVFLGASLLYYSCCMRDETGEHASWDRHPMQSHVMGSQATRANNPGSSTPFYFTLHADLKPYQLLLFYHWRKK